MSVIPGSAYLKARTTIKAICQNCSVRQINDIKPFALANIFSKGNAFCVMFFFFYRQLWNLTAQFFKFVFPYNICPWKKKPCFMFMVNIRRLKAVGELMKQSTCPNNVKIRLNQINLIMIMTTWTTKTSGTKMSVWCDICSFYPMRLGRLKTAQQKD